MAGRRLDVDSIGESYEVFADSLLSRIATLTRIGTKQDFGTDIYCQPRVNAGARMETVTELCLLQVKGGSSKLTYGGGDRNNEWKLYEFEWLKSLWAPLYLARVDEQYQRVDLFSLWPIWWVLWQCDTPFMLVFTESKEVDTEHTFTQPTKEPTIEGAKAGDGHTWTIQLGPPLLRLTHQNLNDDGFRSKAVDVLRRWILTDRQTVARFHAGVPFIDAMHTWTTNEFPTVYQELLATDPRPGMNIERLTRALAPSLLALGAHLQHQDDKAAFHLIPLLDWVQSRGYGNQLTPTLVEKLRRALNENVGPATYL
jgi:hypothetical protein